nr:hypothetical protein [Tanacetum cinerariifolium]
DGEEEESSEDDEAEEAFEEDEDEEEEHLALTDSDALPAIDHVPSAKVTESFNTDKFAATPPPHQTIVLVSITHLHRVRISVRPHTSPSPSTKALIAEYASVPTPSSPPPFPIPSPPLLLPPLYTCPTYACALLGNKATMANMPSRKRLCLTALASRFEVRESSTTVVAGQTGHTFAHRGYYGSIDTLDASIQASEGRVMTAIWEVNERVTDLSTTQRQDACVVEDMSMDLEALFTAQEASFTALEAQTKSLQREKMPPKKTTTLMFDDAIKALVAQSVADSLAEHKANRSRIRDANFESGGGSGRRTVPTAHECTYSVKPA